MPDIKWFECSVAGCDRARPYRHGYCGMHYERWKNNGDPLITRKSGRKKIRGTQLCLHGGCSNYNDGGKGYCKAHYAKLVRTGTSNGRPQTKGPYIRSRKAEGYVRLEFPDGTQQYEHRYVMERKIGRALFHNEQVHHINGIRDDNRPENLELWVHSHPSGQRVEDQVRWAIEILNTYEEKYIDAIRDKYFGRIRVRTDGKRSDCGHVHVPEYMCSVQSV